MRRPDPGEPGDGSAPIPWNPSSPNTGPGIFALPWLHGGAGGDWGHRAATLSHPTLPTSLGSSAGSATHRLVWKIVCASAGGRAPHVPGRCRSVVGCPPGRGRRGSTRRGAPVRAWAGFPAARLGPGCGRGQGCTVTPHRPLALRLRDGAEVTNPALVDSIMWDSRVPIGSTVPPAPPSANVLLDPYFRGGGPVTFGPPAVSRRRALFGRTHQRL